MKHWDFAKEQRNKYGEPFPAVTYGYWLRVRGNLEYFGGPAEYPVLVNPKLNPVARFALWLLHRRRLNAWKLENTKPPTANKIRSKTLFEMSQAVDTPQISRRTLDPSDHIKGMFTNGVSFMPARPPSTEADITPHLQYAGISGGFAFAILFMILAGLLYLNHFNGESYLYAALLSLLIATAYAWRQWELSTSRARVTWWAMETAVNQDLDGDGFIGEPIKPRSVPIYHGENTEYINMEDKGGLLASEWREVAVALLLKHGNVSRRGIYDNCKLSQSKSSDAVSILEQGYTNEDKSLNRAGYDFLIHYLPDHLSPTLPRPTR